MDSIEYINPDTINGFNLYAYCKNNPIMYVDPEGNLPWWANLLIGIGVLVVLAAATVVTAGVAGVGIGSAFIAGFAGTTIGAGASGMVATIATSAFAGAVIGAGTSAVASGIITGIKVAVVGGSTQEIGESICTSFMFGTILGGISGGINKVPFASMEELNIGLHMGANASMSLGSYLGQTAYTDGDLHKVSFGGIILSLIGGASAGYLPTKPLLSGYYNYIAIQVGMFADLVHDLRKRYGK